MSVQLIVADECEAVAALIREAFGAMAIPLEPPASARLVTAADIRAHLAAGGGGASVPSGAACVLWAPRQGSLHLSRLAVAPGHRRRGLGWAMLAAAEQAARAQRLPCLTLSTRLALPGNHRLFRRFGFVETGRSAHAGFTEPTSADFTKRLADATLADRPA